MPKDFMLTWCTICVKYKWSSGSSIFQINSYWRNLNLVGWLVGFYGISTFVGYLMPNPFLYKSVLFQTLSV